ncbi:MAG: L,D-transpeptidase family protein [Solirubrobacterales bacterium]
MGARLFVAALIALIAVLAGCGDSGDPSGTDSSTSPATGTEPTTAEAPASQTYFTAGEQLRPVPGPSDPEAAAKALVEGPPQQARGKLETAIPAGTEVEGVEVDGGTATIRVSGEFTKGVPARKSARSTDQESELDARLAQVTFTMGGLEGIDRTRVVAAGRPVAAPRSRSDFARPSPKAPKRKRGELPAHGKASSGVRAVQERLAQLHYLPKGAVDGVDGYRTRQAVMAFQAWEGLERDGIAGPLTKAALADARRPTPKGDGPSRRIEVYRDKGVTLLVKHDRARRVVHTSSGAPGYTTPAGRFEVFRKEENSWSVPYQTWLPWASYFNAGIAFHAYPDVPPYPASHGCVRVPEPEAEHVYDFARIGTPVIVR